MVRAPCCEKMGMKRGPWTAEEDQILISYIHQHGHTNWRALPKQAGLQRCGKSCRLRWTNYLRPDIKRGNFSKEEEETILQLHETLGNRWSAIAARLPGRTDNEIKNVWNTHLKKRLKNKEIYISVAKRADSPSQSKSENYIFHPRNGIESPVSPQQSSSEHSSVTDVTVLPNMSIQDKQMENFPVIDESFWSEELSGENSTSQTEELELQFTLSPVTTDDDMDFWYNLFIRAHGGLPELPEF